MIAAEHYGRNFPYTIISFLSYKCRNYSEQLNWLVQCHSASNRL